MPPNKIFRCYNMFPYMFKDIYAMTEHLDIVQELGFDTVWLNPLQDATGQYSEDADESNLSKFYLMRRSTQSGFKKNYTRDSIYRHDGC